MNSCAYVCICIHVFRYVSVYTFVMCVCKHTAAFTPACTRNFMLKKCPANISTLGFQQQNIGIIKRVFPSIAENISGRMGISVGLHCEASVITHARWCGIILAKFSTSLVLLALVD